MKLGVHLEGARAVLSSSSEYERSARRPLLMGAAVALGWAFVWVVATLLDVRVIDPRWQTGIVVTTGIASAAAAVWVAQVARRRHLLAADLTVVLTSVAMVGLATVALHGTRWGFSGLWSDSSFRTQMVTRYAANWALVDYGYRDLPAFYPPALGWLEGRLAALSGVPAWQVIKPVQLVLAAVVPILSFILWRRVLPPLSAAMVVLATVTLTVDLQKPDEWLVLACLLPWWLEVVRNARDPAVPEWPWWRHGIILGLLLLTHTFYFLPLAVATLLAMGVDLLRRRGLALPLKRAFLIGAVGVVISSPYWVAMALPRLRGAPSDSLYLRYSYAGANTPPFPHTLDFVGTLSAAGFAWLLWTAWRWHRDGRPDRLAGGLALALTGSYLTMVLGGVAARHDIGLLTFKTDELIFALHATCTVLGLREVAKWLLRRRTSSWAPRVAVTALATVGAVAALATFVDAWIVSTKALIPQVSRYPDGTWPEGMDGFEPFYYPARVDGGDPSVAQVIGTWDQVSGGLPRSETVLVTTRIDMLSVIPVYSFVPLKSIYSHPHGQFDGRVSLLRQVARCPDPDCAADLLRNNPYDRVDGLILERQGDTLSTAVYVDNFPDRTRLDPVDFPAGLFEAPQFKRRDIGRVSVIAVR